MTADTECCNIHLSIFRTGGGGGALSHGPPWGYLKKKFYVACSATTSLHGKLMCN